MDRVEAARLMGMKVSEVIDVEETANVIVVTTHDGVRTRLPGTGVVVAVDELPAGEPAEDDDEPDGDDVPDGSAKEVLAWVGEDSDRAIRALEAEERRESPRKVLMGQLEKVVG